MSSKIEFEMKRVLFPKNKILELGTYSIVSCCLIKKIEGEDIVLNQNYGTFTLISYTPTLFNYEDSYVATVEGEETKYGMSYHLLELEKEEEELTEGDKRNFISSVFTESQTANLYWYLDDPYEAIKNKETEKLTSVKGIGLKNVLNVYKKFEENQKYLKLFAKLSQYHLTRATMDSLLDKFGDPDVVIKRVKENVYELANIVDGIGFHRCDAIALSTGMKKNSPYRIQAFMQHYLMQEAENGNSWILPKVFFSQISPNLQVKLSDDELRDNLYQLHDKGIIYWNESKTKIGLSYYYNLEKSIYDHINRIKNAKNNPYHRDRDYEKKCIEECEANIGYSFTEEQKEAINGIMDNQISLLVGYAGSGKSSLIRTIATFYSKKGFTPCICTLSGKAAARIQEATDFEGSTIHRALGYNPLFGKFTMDETNPLPSPIVIVDETSFVGGELFLSLLKAIPNGTRLVLVGDDKQLPSIGACNIFFDLINSNKIKLNKLTQIHRQAEKSGVIIASKNVREGKQIVRNGWNGKETRGELQDFTIDVYENRLVSKPKLMDYYKSYVKSLEDAKETQIILATKSKGDCNTFDINNEIQEYLNPKAAFKSEICLTRNGKQFILREGDRVINRKNDYKAEIFHSENQETTEIFNGFCGEVIAIQDNKVVVKFDMVTPLIVFSYDTLQNLELAYALTVHLFQGSQVNRVIYLIDNTSYIMNTRELVYTAITRASKECIFLAQGEALKRAINTSQTINKQTYLKEMLIENA